MPFLLCKSPAGRFHLLAIMQTLLGYLALLSFLLASDALALAFGSKPAELIKPYKRAPLQDIVTWDEHSIFVRGERVLFYSGEFHPFRLPVPSLWIDVFQKIKALGYSGVSFYTDWALLEGEPGVYREDGIFDSEPFFKAAQDAGIYLLARPGPYINAEVSGGGFPGWLERVKGIYRTPAPGYLNATNLYVKSIGETIAKAQITNGGPVILYQPENEYTYAAAGVKFPDPDYMAYVEQQARDAGIVVPFISNDASPLGHNAPGTGKGEVDIYGHDGYPLGFDCANPTTWPDGNLPTNFRALHEQQSPNTPYSIIEFQGGSFDPWGGLGFAQCGELINSEFERVFYKNDFSFGMTIFNIYMTYGGTNWGNLGHPGGYTSYDYAAVISEERLVTREKYSEAKLIANFFQASPEFLTAVPQNSTALNGSYSNNGDISITRLDSKKTKFFIARHSAYNTYDSTTYKLEIPTSVGTIFVPRTGGSLTLNGRDSKVHVADYNVGGFNLLYSTAEIFTWKKHNGKTVLVVYGGPGEHHELAFTQAPAPQLVEGRGVKFGNIKGQQVLNWQTTAQRRIVNLGPKLSVYILDRNSAYNYWTLNPNSSKYSKSGNPDDLIIRAGYLLRTATVAGDTLSLVGDLNATTPVEIISGAPANLRTLSFNGAHLPFQQDKNSKVVTARLVYKKPSVSLPDVTNLPWKYIDSLPEIQPSYSDAGWKFADLKQTYNDQVNNTTPTSLFASDYGFNTGNLLFRGHFTASGAEKSIFLHTQGGSAFGMSAWLNSTFLGSWAGADYAADANSTFSFPSTLSKGKPYVLTVLLDHTGIDEAYTPGELQFKNPRGILNYTLSGRPQSAVTWKLTGNLGGEQYIDKVRGPLNEGGLYFERQGFHQPKAPTTSSLWKSGSRPTDGITAPGVRYYYTSFDLNIPTGYDVPLAFTFGNGTVDAATKDYRALLYVNGYQFGKYVHNVGPQDTFPVPEGILNHRGPNYVGLSLWALDKAGAKLESFALTASAYVQTGMDAVVASPQPAWAQRKGAY
ncbi:hypothetical protein FH972_009494 [Carpinus fangiana]|uniref:Beta-galactosidase n=1 Tax=Carpinus fangiana TaxID=176857 RepID=A0A660KME8_9ROSI|nr:hypothetical protein FH972_009494 [Carpinus fangiana]